MAIYTVSLSHCSMSCQEISKHCTLITHTKVKLLLLTQIIAYYSSSMLTQTIQTMLATRQLEKGKLNTGSPIYPSHWA